MGIPPETPESGRPTLWRVPGGSLAFAPALRSLDPLGCHRIEENLGTREAGSAAIATCTLRAFLTPKLALNQLCLGGGAQSPRPSGLFVAWGPA